MIYCCLTDSNASSSCHAAAVLQQIQAVRLQLLCDFVAQAVLSALHTDCYHVQAALLCDRTILTQYSLIVAIQTLLANPNVSRAPS